MKFEPSYKLISGFNYISFTTLVFLVSAFIFISLLLTEKPVEEKPIVKNKIEIAKQDTEPQVNSNKEPKTETIAKDELKEQPVFANSIVKKVDAKNPGIEFELDFGGKAIRKIKSYLVPDYEEFEKGGETAKLNFTIKPDGSVAKIYPVVKTNSNLELKSIFAMRQWRFESLKKSADQVDQPAIITFLYH
jgi:hypothetical protein